MITFIAFVLTILGGINWLMIGFLQYDFIAGLFGFQASVFSRICYILFGIGSVYLVLRAIVNRGTFKIFERKKRQQRSAPENTQGHAISYESKGSFDTNSSGERLNSDENFAPQSGGLFDEHLRDDR